MRSLELAAAPLLAVLACAAPAPTAGPPRPADPLTTHDPNLYLFVDDYWIAENDGLVRVLRRPEPLPEPVVAPDRPEVEKDCAWGNVIREPDGRFRMWYTTSTGNGHQIAKAGVWGKGADDFAFHPRSDDDVRETEIMLGKYAESADGVHWVKPRLSLFAFRGSRDNNIILNGERAARQTDGALTNFDGYTVVRDDAERDPARRYKMVAHWESVHCWDNHPLSGSLGRAQAKIDWYWSIRGKYITYSPDGIRWDRPLKRLHVDGSGDRCLVVRDHRHGRWWLNNRPPNGYGAAGLAVSGDLEDWTATEPLLAPDPSEAQGHPQIESFVPFNYGNQDLGFLITQQKPPGIFLCYLASHHDGEPWRRIGKVGETPFIAPGPPGSYLGTGAVPLHNEPFIVGNRLFVYFNAFALAGPMPPKGGRRSIGLATLRRDGFVGLTPSAVPGGGSPKEAGLLTRPVKVAGSHLYLNVERLAGGRVTVALLNPDRSPIPGFGLAEAQPIETDGVRQRAEWKDQADVRALDGREVMVRLRMEGGTTVYAFAFGD